jgi:hypothetical protein
MKSTNLIFRRTHLFLGMLLIPWMFIYAFSSFMLNHGPYFRQFRPGPDAWTRVWEKDYRVELPAAQEELRTVAGTILNENGLGGSNYGVRRNGQRAIINVPRFLHPMRVTYQGAEGKLLAEQRDYSWMEMFLNLHFRAGYGQPGTLQNLWGFLVDLVCVSFLVWVVTGLYLWWKIPQTRKWGWLAISAGCVSFVAVLLKL